jgi:hypothetical protein
VLPSNPVISPSITEYEEPQKIHNNGVLQTKMFSTTLTRAASSFRCYCEFWLAIISICLVNQFIGLIIMDDLDGQSSCQANTNQYGIITEATCIIPIPSEKKFATMPIHRW